MKRVLSLVLVLTLFFSLAVTTYAQKQDKPDTGIKVGADIKQKGSTLPTDKVPAAALNGLEKKATATYEANQETQRVLVLFKDKVDKVAVEQAKGKINREYNNIPALAVEIPVVALKGLEKNPNVASIETNFIVKLSAQTQD